MARARCEAQGTRWHLISQAEFSERVARARQSRKRHQETLVALVTTTEMEVLPADQRHHAQSLSEFTKFKRLRLMEGRAGQK